MAGRVKKLQALDERRSHNPSPSPEEEAACPQQFSSSLISCQVVHRADMDMTGAGLKRSSPWAAAFLRFLRHKKIWRCCWTESGGDSSSGCSRGRGFRFPVGATRTSGTGGLETFRPRIFGYNALAFFANTETEFFTEYDEASQYDILEVVGKRSYGIVWAALDTKTGEKVAIKKINDVFEHVSDASRIFREIKRLRLLRHPDVVEIKHIMLPPSRREFRDIYVVFGLMESDLHQVIKANDDLTPEHHQLFLYQLL
ncbi:Mitogen-activated protein kinase 9 [Platanthera guangdongensis]|uniref:Mitogen-activated protein kinase 9 n=1 Tax=Platanthera guangdongensis TaxID=2320717 RepID=A0ABR2M556_9ASPA